MSWLLGPGHRGALQGWASTSVDNLRHHPVGSLVLSAFLTPDHPLAWPTLAAMGLFSADRVLGPARSALACGAAHLVGTLVSEGIVAWRVHTGALPPAARHLTDIGPSYVVVAGLTLTLLAGPASRCRRCRGACVPGTHAAHRSALAAETWSGRGSLAGSWARRAVALAGFVVLWPYLFTGLTHWDVSAVGHLVSVTLGTVAAGLGHLRSRRRVAPATG